MFEHSCESDPDVMQENMEQLGSVPFNEEDMEYAKKV